MTAPPLVRPKGNALLRWSYARWIQIIAHADLLGRDKRPSQSKMAALYALIVTGTCALAQVIAPLIAYVIVRPAGVAPEVGSVTTPVSLMFVAALSASFGMKVYTMFLSRYQAQSNDTRAETVNRSDTRSDTRQDLKSHTITETIERKIVDDADGDYEPTP